MQRAGAATALTAVLLSAIVAGSAGAGEQRGGTLSTAASVGPAATPSKTSFKRAKVSLTRSKIAGDGKRLVITDKTGYAQYIFSKDKRKGKRRSRCYGACAKAWPPLLTKRRPKAVGRAKQSKLGTTKRRDGTKQVTYRGLPLYYYEHEPRPKFVGCHDVFLNGGDWYAVKRNGKRLP